MASFAPRQILSADPTRTNARTGTASNASASPATPVTRRPGPPPSAAPASAASTRQDNEDNEEDAPADPSPMTSTLPIPPEGGPGGGPPAKSADEMMEALRAFAKPHGYGLTRRQAANKRDGQYTRYSVHCDRDGHHESTSKGIRKSKSRKVGCLFRGMIKSTKAEAGGWIFQLATNPEYRVHNHGPMVKTTRVYYHNGSRDSWHGTVTAGGKFTPEAGRYQLYIGLFCPYAHRVNLVRMLKGLDEIIPISVVKPYPKGDDKGWPGWEFAGCRGSSDVYEGATSDPAYGSRYLHDLYFRADKTYHGRFSVPVLWDKKLGTIVNNESLELMRWMQTAFNGLLEWGSPERSLNLYPAAHQAKIDEVKEWMTSNLNSGVYKAGFATDQGSYDKSVPPVFAALNQLELLIYTNGGPYILGEQMTELDILAYPTIIRFDVIYVQHFKCNLGTIRGDYPVIHEWLKNLYWNVKGFKETTDFRHIKENYSKSHAKVNPLAITPQGPFPHIKSGVNLDFLGQLHPGSVEHPAVLEFQKTLPAI